MKRTIITALLIMIAVIPFMGTRTYAAQSDLETKLRSGLDSFSTEIEVTKKVGKVTDAAVDTFYDEISDAYYSLMAEKKYFYVISALKASGYSKNGTLYVTVKPSYITTKSSLKSYEKKFDKKLAEICSGMDKNWTNIQKVAYLHDRLVVYTDYLDDGDARLTSTPWSVLVDKKGICTGYARTYAIMLSEIGIESKLVQNDDHQWDLVKLGKNWYHVDCTYDDMFLNGEQKKGYVYHDYFLKSDKALTDHAGYKPKIKAQSNIYDKMDWSKANSAFAFYGKGLLYTGKDGIYLFDTAKNKLSKMVSVDPKWEIQWREYYPGYYYDRWMTREGMHCHIAQYKKQIYYNQAHGIYRYDPAAGTVTAVYTNDRSDDMITSLYITNDKLYATFTNKNSKDKDYKITDLK